MIVRGLTLFTLLGSAACALAQSPIETLDESWARVCANAQAGTAFAARCSEILDAGPGSANRASNAAIGNNLGTISAQLSVSGDSASAEQADGGVDGIALREDFGAFGLFVSAHSTRVRHSASDFENAWRGRDRGGLLGVDYRLRQNLIIGAATQFASHDMNFRSSNSSTDVDRSGVNAFISWMANENFSLDAYLGYAGTDYDIERAIAYDLVLRAGQPDQQQISISELARGDTDGRQHVAGAALNFSEAYDRWTVGGNARIDWLDSRIDGYTETGGGGLGQRFDSQNSTSLTASIGGSVGYNASLSWGILSPQLSLRWIREFDQDERDIRSRFVNDSASSALDFRTQRPDRSFGQANIGVVATLPAGNSMFIRYSHMIGHSLYEQSSVNLGIRFEL